MKYQRKLEKKEELNKWLDIEVTTGISNKNVENNFEDFRRFVSKFNEKERKILEKTSGLPYHAIYGFDEPDHVILQLALTKTFIDNQKLGILEEIVKTNASTKSLEIALFLKLSKSVIEKSFPPLKEYIYCIYRAKGSPVTWQHVVGKITSSDLEELDRLIQKIPHRLKKKFKRDYHFLYKEKIGNLIIYIFSKIYDDFVSKGSSPKEVSRSVYSYLLLDTSKELLGYVSKSRREIKYIYQELKTKPFKDRLFTTRNEKDANSRELFINLIEAYKHTEMDIVRLQLNKTSLEGAPAIRISGTYGGSINAAISEIRTNLLNNLDLSDLKDITFDVKNRYVTVYCYGDDWGRRTFNIKTPNLSFDINNRVVRELRSCLGFDIKTTSVLTDVEDNKEVIGKLLRKQRIAIDNKPPEYVEKLIVFLVKHKLLKEPRIVSKRQCIDYFGCKTLSWKDWRCPKCKRKMQIVGKEITINLNRTRNSDGLLKSLLPIMSSNFGEYIFELTYIQRKKSKYQVIKIVDKKTLAPILITVVERAKEASYIQELKQEYGIITIVHPQIASTKEMLRALGCEVLEMETVFAELKGHFEKETNRIKGLFRAAVTEQKRKSLETIYRNLRNAVTRLKDKPIHYTPQDFEIDIVNIMKGVVPTVIRLGAGDSGSRVPDGYCGYNKELSSGIVTKLFGWDAKYTSTTKKYALSDADVKKQKGYIKWLKQDKCAKEIGSLDLYGIITNASETGPLNDAIDKLWKYRGKPRMCKIVVIRDDILIKLGDWILLNRDKIQNKGPKISREIFNWIKGRPHFGSRKWSYICGNDWESLECSLTKHT